MLHSNKRRDWLEAMTWAYENEREGKFYVDTRLSQDVGVPIETWLLFIRWDSDGSSQGIVLDPITSGPHDRISDRSSFPFRRIGIFLEARWPFSRCEGLQSNKHRYYRSYY